MKVYQYLLLQAANLFSNKSGTPNNRTDNSSQLNFTEITVNNTQLFNNQTMKEIQTAIDRAIPRYEKMYSEARSIYEDLQNITAMNVLSTEKIRQTGINLTSFDINLSNVSEFQYVHQLIESARYKIDDEMLILNEKIDLLKSVIENITKYQNLLNNFIYNESKNYTTFLNEIEEDHYKFSDAIHNILISYPALYKSAQKIEEISYLIRSKVDLLYINYCKNLEDLNKPNDTIIYSDTNSSQTIETNKKEDYAIQSESKVINLNKNTTQIQDEEKIDYKKIEQEIAQKRAFQNEIIENYSTQFGNEYIANCSIAEQIAKEARIALTMKPRRSQEAISTVKRTLSLNYPIHIDKTSPQKTGNRYEFVKEMTFSFRGHRHVRKMILGPVPDFECAIKDYAITMFNGNHRVVFGGIFQKNTTTSQEIDFPLPGLYQRIVMTARTTWGNSTTSCLYNIGFYGPL